MKITHYDDHRPARAAAYPSIGDQLDALWKLLEQQHGAFPLPVPEAEVIREHIKMVKAAYPKSPNVK
jgi:hypothetical protein